MKPRKIIFECKTGSHLYGTNTPKSDEDYMGVFLPSTEDLFGLENCPTEWTQNVKISDGERNSIGDIDRKYFSIKKFLTLLAAGQSNQVEMFFAPDEAIITTSPEWELIRANKDLFISQNSVTPILGFAVAQSYKAVVKGENLNLIRGLIKAIEGEFFLNSSQRDITLNPDAIFVKKYHSAKHTTIQDCIGMNNSNGAFTLFGSEVKFLVGDDDIYLIEIAGRKIQTTNSIRHLYEKLNELEARYGTRSEDAAQKGQDYKSLHHAYRLLILAKELKSTGRVTLPMKPEDVEFLMKIKRGEYRADYFDELDAKIKEVKSLESGLRESPDMGKINQLCIRMLNEYYRSDK